MQLNFSRFDFSKFDFNKLEAKQKLRQEKILKARQEQLEFHKDVQEHIDLFPTKFLDFVKLCKIRDKSSRIVPFELNDFQREAYEDILKQYQLQQNIRIVEVKPRQIGMTTFYATFLFYSSLLFDLSGAVFAHVNDTAKNCYRMMEILYLNLPPNWQNLNKANFKDSGSGEIEFARGAIIDFGSSLGKDPMRGKTKQWLLLTESAFYNTIDMEGFAKGKNTFLVLDSSPNGTGNMLYQKAEVAQNEAENVDGYIVRFSRWWKAKDYVADGDFNLSTKAQDYIEKYSLQFLTTKQVRWLQGKIAELGEQKFNKEYPPSLEVCFAENVSDCFVETSYITKAFLTEKIELSGNYPLIIGIDVGHSRDKTICYVRQNVNVLMRIELDTDIKNQFLSFKRNAEVLKDKVLSFNRQNLSVCKIFIDGSDEDGREFASILRQVFSTANLSTFIVEAVSFGGIPLVNNDGKKIGKNLRESMYFKLARWLSSETGASIPFNERLREELLASKTYFDSTGVLRMKSKIEIKENLPNARSPDDADALALTFAGWEPVAIEGQRNSNVRAFASGDDSFNFYKTYG